MRARGLNTLLKRMRPKTSSGLMQILLKRIKIEEQQEEFNDDNKRKDMFHYLLQVKDPDTGLRAYSTQEVSLTDVVFLPL